MSSVHTDRLQARYELCGMKSNASSIHRVFLAIVATLSVAGADEAIWFSGPASCGGICVSSPPGAEPVPLNPHILESIEEDYISSFDLSPDGQSIVFIELQESIGWHFSDVWMMDSDGTNLREIFEGNRGWWETSTSRGEYWSSSETNGLSLGIQWSPDGLEILVCAYPGSFLFMDEEGSILYYWEGYGNIFFDRFFGTDLQWDPEGDIVYQGYSNDRSESDTLFVRSRDGSIKHRIFIPGVQSPQFSPDGSKLAYGEWIRRGPSKSSSLFVMDVASGERQFIADVAESDDWMSPIGPFSWSPSGNQIAYRGIDGLYVINADGTDPTFLFETGIVWDIDWISSTSTGVSPTSWGAVKHEKDY